jgi:hypothetical protein
MVVIQKGLEEDVFRSQVRVMSDLVDKYIQQVFEKNRRMVDVQRVKEEIESKIQNNVTEQELRDMQEELHELISSYEVLVSDKISIFNDVIKNMREIGKNNDSIARNEEDITRLKSNVEIVQRDIN